MLTTRVLDRLQQQLNRIVASHDGVRGIIADTEVTALSDRVHDLQKHILLLGELRIAPEPSL